MNNIWQINDDSEVKTVEVNGSNLYIINNFYKYPEKVLEFFKTKEATFHKFDTPNSKNRIEFQDRRHRFYFKEFEKVENHLAKIVGQQPKNKGLVLSNCFKFYDNTFNDWENKYWIPHIDFGYNAIVYFDDAQTNLYKKVMDHDFNKLPEHQVCWIDKKYYEVLLTIQGKFNTLFAFDGKIPHGQAIDSKKYTKEYRITQPIFFK